jgi:hypothetical protein
MKGTRANSAGAKEAGLASLSQDELFEKLQNYKNYLTMV